MFAYPMTSGIASAASVVPAITSSGIRPGPMGRIPPKIGAVCRFRRSVMAAMVFLPQDLPGWPSLP